MRAFRKERLRENLPTKNWKEGSKKNRIKERKLQTLKEGQGLKLTEEERKSNEELAAEFEIKSKLDKGLEATNAEITKRRV